MDTAVVASTVGVVLVSSGIGAWFASKAQRLRAELSETREELGTATSLSETYSDRLGQLQGEVDRLHELQERTDVARDDANARADRYFTAIASACLQRDEWCKDYHAACSGFMRTQQALLAEIGRLSRIAKAPPRKVFEQMVEGYREEHAEALARVERAGGDTKAAAFLAQQGDPPPAEEKPATSTTA